MLPLSFIATLVVLVCLFIFQTTIDIIRRRGVNATRQNLLTLGKKHSERSITVILKAAGSKPDTIALLDHLRRQSYTNLQILVIPRSRTNKRAVAYLQTYRREHSTMNLRIVTTKARITDQTIISRYVRTDLSCYMAVTDRLPHGFFERVSYEFTDPTLAQLQVPYLPRPNRSIASLAYTWQTIRHITIASLLSKTPNIERTMSIMLRSAQAQSKQTPAHLARQARLSFGLMMDVSSRKNDSLMTAANIAIAALLVAGFIVIRSSDWFTTAVVLTAIYIITNILWMLPLRGYTPYQRFLLILGLPFSIFYYGRKTSQK